MWQSLLFCSPYGSHLRFRHYDVLQVFTNMEEKEVQSSAKAVRLNHTVTISALPNIAACHHQSKNKDYKLLTWTS